MRHPLQVLLGILITLLPATPSTLAQVSSPPTRPNIVLVVTDDQGWGDAGCYWDTDVQTPVMDSVAAHGVRFLSFRVNPLCAPTRASLLSGQYSLESGMWRGPSRESEGEHPRRIKKDVKLLPELLKEVGYATGIFGKWHLGYESPNLPNERGFDEFVGFLGGAHPYSARNVRTILKNGKPWPTEQHLTDLFTEQAVAFIRKHRDRPFFCYVPYNAVHGPLANQNREATSGKPLWLNKYEQLGIDLPRRDYNAVLGHADHSVGRILEELRGLGLIRRTFVIYLSDNGALVDKYPGSNGPLRGEKGTTYEGGIRVPCVMQWEGTIPAGTVSRVNAIHFDLFSTILDAAGIPIPRSNGRHPVHGVSLLPHLKSAGSVDLQDRYLFWDLFGRMAAVHGKWKIVGQAPNHRGNFSEALPNIEATRFELFDIEADLGEKTDLSDRHPEVHDDLKTRLISWFADLSR